MNFHRDTRNWLYPFIAATLAVVMTVTLSCQAAQTVPSPVPFGETATFVAQATARAVETPTLPEPTVTPAPATPTATPEATQLPTPTATPVPPATPSALMTSPDYGIQAFLWWRPEVATRDLGLIQDMGFRWVKQVFAWSDIEGAKKGHFNWDQADAVVQNVNDAGLKLLARLDRAPAWSGAGAPNGPPTNYEDFGDFCYAMASRYKGRIHAYQIWNEPNLAREWGSRPPNPQEYVRLLAIAYQRIKEADPDALIISAGLTPTGTQNDEVMPDTTYLEQMYQAGLPNYADMVGMHAAGFKAPPELSPDELVADPNKTYGEHRFNCFRHVEELRAIMEQHGDGDRRVVILEFGWTTDPRPDSPYHWHAVTEEQQADYMVRAYQYAQEHWRPWIALMSLIYIADPYWEKQQGDREEYWWAITYPQYPTAKVRPAYDALRNMPKD